MRRVKRNRYPFARQRGHCSHDGHTTTRYILLLPWLTSYRPSDFLHWRYLFWHCTSTQELSFEVRAGNMFGWLVSYIHGR